MPRTTRRTSWSRIDYWPWWAITAAGVGVALVLMLIGMALVSA